MSVSSFLFETSFEKMSSFVSLILRSHSGEHCHSPSRYKDRSKCSSHFLESGSLFLRLILFLNVSTNINCSLNCYLVEIMISSLYYFSLLLFKSLDLDKCLYLVLFSNLSIRFLLVYSRSFSIIFLF